MGRTKVLHEVLVMRFEEVYGRFHKGRLNCEEAAGLLGISISSFHRIERVGQLRYQCGRYKW